MEKNNSQLLIELGDNVLNIFSVQDYLQYIIYKAECSACGRKAISISSAIESWPRECVCGAKSLYRYQGDEYGCSGQV
jgi:hypothetical protein